MSSLAEGEKQLLLRLARRSLTAAAESLPPVPERSEQTALLEPGGAFVTLLKQKRLRGCIGQLPGSDPLIEVVAHCAHAVASEDPRFPRVEVGELGEIEIEISVLSALSQILPVEILVGKHGLLVASGSQRGVLLPQVALQFGWNRERFLAATCEKAGLAADAWQKPDAQLYGFTTEIFSEADFPAARGWGS